MVAEWVRTCCCIIERGRESIMGLSQVGMECLTVCLLGLEWDGMAWRGELL